MAINFLDDITLNNNEIQNVVIQKLGTDPAGVTGKIIYNTGTNTIKYYNGSAWISLPDGQGMTEWDLQGDSGTNQTITNGTTVDWAGGTGITTATTTNALTITNSLPFNGLTLAATTGSSSTIADEGTITIAAGAGITTTNNGSGQVTIAATGSGSMSSFILTGDSGDDQSITDGNTLNVAGGTNISTVVGSTDKVTINLDASPTLAGDLTVNGGDIILGGTGRIQGVDTVTAGTDAANKTYVDNSVVGNLVFQGGYDAALNEPDLDSSPSSSIKKGWSYVVTDAGNFFTEAVEVGDFLIAKQDAPTALDEWVTVQNNIALATASTVGIGNVANSTATNDEGLSLSYANGTATVGFNIKNNLSSASGLADDDKIVIFQGSQGAQGNFSLNAQLIPPYVSSKNSFSGTTTNQTTHTFTHNLDTTSVMVQLFDTSSGETVYATVDRTSITVVTATTATSASLTALITKIG